jgi:hypothetical protein
MELQVIQNKIHEIHGVFVMLDSDLASMYEVETYRLNESVKRNIARFPDDFMFQLTQEEASNLISQFAISSWGGVRKLPYAFTQEGVAMLSGILRSPKAIEVNISIMRAFVSMRQFLLNNISQIKEISELHDRVQLLEEYNEETMKAINDLSENTGNHLDDIYIALAELAEKRKDEDKPRNPIGFRQ